MSTKGFPPKQRIARRAYYQPPPQRWTPKPAPPEARENALITPRILDISSWISALFETSATPRPKGVLRRRIPLRDMDDVPTTITPDLSTSNTSEWHSIRPWTPHLTLAVREITSVSATFILSSSLDARHATENEPESELSGDTSNDTTDDVFSDSRGIIADAMSHGLSVEVNGSNWQRVILRMNDHADEAIIVIYGLHPGRQYDIDLALVSGGTMRKQVTTEDADGATVDNERSDDHHAIVPPEALSASTSNGNECSSLPSTSQTPTPEERLRMVSHQLNALHAEQSTLQAVLKSSRRDAHKTATGLRAEIDVLKRASEKAGIAEYKGRQRVRTLEDAVRRANEGREELEQLMAADEQELPELEGKRSEAEGLLETVRKEADAVRAEREKREEEWRKRKEGMKGECATMNQKLERLTVKRERLESSVIPDLETQLAELQREIELAERVGFQNGDVSDGSYRDSSRSDTQRRRLSHPPLAQRTTQAPISPPHFSRHQPRSQSAYRTSIDSATGVSHPPGLHPSSSISHSGSSGFIPAMPALSHSTNTIFSSPSTSSSLSRSTSSVGSSTLSYKAPPFEPTRNLRASLSSPGTSGAFSSSGLLSMTNQGSFSPSPSTFSSTGSNSSFSLSGSYVSPQRPLQASHKSHDADQVRLGWPSTSRGPAGEEGWTPSND